MSAQEEDTYLSADDVARMLGISIASIRRMTATRMIPHFKIGRRVIFNKAEVDEWIKALRVESRWE